jgi:hypothetical protein
MKAPQIIMLMSWFHDQENLAVVVYKMWLYRSVLLGLPADKVSVLFQPEGYVPSDATLDAVASSPGL